MDITAALADIDEVLRWASMRTPNDDNWANSESGRLIRALQCIARHAPERSYYREQADRFAKLKAGYPNYPEADVIGIVEALREDLEQGGLVRFEEMIHANVYGDLLSQAEGLHTDGGFHRAATVLAGAALEEHIRMLASKHGTGTTNPDGKPKQASLMNADLKKAGVYPETQRAIVDGWQKLRNEAAHGKPGFEAPDTVHVAMVAPMIAGIRGFLVNYPA